MRVDQTDFNSTLTCAEDQGDQQSSHILELRLVEISKYITVVVNHGPAT